MGNWQGLDLISVFAKDIERVSHYFILTPESTQQDIHQAELNIGQTLPDVVYMILKYWNEQGPTLILERIPQFLAFDKDFTTLNPTGIPMKDLFPEIWDMIQGTQQIIIIANGERQEDILIAGLSNVSSKKRTKVWGGYLPKSSDEITFCELQTLTNFSPQMKQMYFRLGGVPDNFVCPYFYRPESLARGMLYTTIYREIADQIPLSAEIVEQLKTFVVLSDSPTGDSQGFFADEKRIDDEYTIYQWDHETAQFSLWAPNFAKAVTRLLGGDT